MNTKYDDEIREVEERLMRERHALAANAEDLSTTAREAAASPKGLLAALAVGFLLGELTAPKRRGRRDKHDKSHAIETTKKAGVGGLLLSGVLAYVRANYGSPMALGRHAWNYYSAAQRARQAAMARSTGYPPPTVSAAPAAASTQASASASAAPGSGYGQAAPSSHGHAAG